MSIDISPMFFCFSSVSLWTLEIALFFSHCFSVFLLYFFRHSKQHCFFFSLFFCISLDTRNSTIFLLFWDTRNNTKNAALGLLFKLPLKRSVPEIAREKRQQIKLHCITSLEVYIERKAESLSKIIVLLLQHHMIELKFLSFSNFFTQTDDLPK